MALDMHPERRRRLMAIDRARRDWEERYGIDDAEWVFGGKTGPDRRSPTPEQATELERTIRELSGQDPDTGLFRS